MKRRQLIGMVFACSMLALFSAPVVFSDDAPHDASAPSLATDDSENRDVSVSIARERAKVTQRIHTATLGMLHDRFFHRDKSVLPARAMQDIFDELESESGVKSCWISASLPPMSIDHEPESEFELNASKQIAAGAQQVEIVEDGYYRRAVPIPLKGGCLSCHENVLQSSGRKKFAALVTSLPLHGTEQESE